MRVDLENADLTGGTGASQQDYGIVKWWRDVESMGAAEFARHANSTQKGSKRMWRSHDRDIKAMAGQHAKFNNNEKDMNKAMTGLHTNVQLLLQDMGHFVAHEGNDRIELPKLSQRHLKQVDLPSH